MAKLTKKDMEALRAGQTLVVKCDTAGEFISACQIARREKARNAREDGMAYCVTQNAREASLTITLREPC